MSTAYNNANSYSSSLRRRNQMITYLSDEGLMQTCVLYFLHLLRGNVQSTNQERRVVRLGRVLQQLSSLPMVKRSLSPSLSQSLHIQHNQQFSLSFSFSLSPQSFVVQAMRSQVGLSFQDFTFAGHNAWNISLKWEREMLGGGIIQARWRQQEAGVGTVQQSPFMDANHEIFAKRQNQPTQESIEGKHSPERKQLL